MLNGPANLRKFHWRKCDKFYLKDSYFLCCKTHCIIEWKFAKIGILACVDFWIMGHAYSFCMFILDLQNSWTQALLDIGGPVFFSCSMKDNKVHTFKRSLQGILASIIEMLQYGKYNSHSACHSGHYCCKNKNYSYLPCLQNKHSLRPCANVCMSMTRVPCRSLAAIFWWKSEPLLRPKLCDWSKQ